MSVKEYEPSGHTQNLVSKYESLDTSFKSSWEELYERFRSEFDQLDKLREQRNVALDEATRALRDEATRLDVKVYKSFRYGKFQVSKPVGSDSFRAVETVKLAKTLGVLKPMEDHGAVATKIEINYEAMKEFLKANSLEDKFATVIEAGDAKTPSVTGPKPIPAFGAEVKGGK